jgi:hypothetical protein
MAKVAYVPVEGCTHKQVRANQVDKLSGHQEIKCHIIFDVKNKNGFHKEGLVCGRRSHDEDTQLTNILQCLVVYVDVLVISNAPMEVIEQIGKEFKSKNGEYGLPTMEESNSVLEKCVRVSKNYVKAGLRVV